MTVAVLGATGYAGQMLMRLLLDHPKVTEILPVSASFAGRSLDEQDGGIGPDPAQKLSQGRNLLSRNEVLSFKPEVIFSALPHGASADFCEIFFDTALIFDLSADFRLRDPDIHESVYGGKFPYPKRRLKAVYGLVEWARKEIKETDLVALPGCFPTCVLLPLIPLALAGLLQEPVTVNALSGISGAGKTPKKASLYVERAENVLAYNPGRSHRHLPEITQELKRVGSKAPLFFTPHLVPMRRGMLASINFSVPKEGPFASLPSCELHRVIGEKLRESYADSPFIRLRAEGLPSSHDVVGSNRCDIGWMLANGEGIRQIYLFSVIDNLLKGAAGQAVQAFNIRFGFSESCGLPLRGEV